MVSRWVRVKAGCAFALACVLPCAFTPGAFAADDGRWPVVNDTVASAWKQGIDGSGVKVAVLDVDEKKKRISLSMKQVPKDA